MNLITNRTNFKIYWNSNFFLKTSDCEWFLNLLGTNQHPHKNDGSYWLLSKSNVISKVGESFRLFSSSFNNSSNSTASVSILVSVCLEWWFALFVLLTAEIFFESHFCSLFVKILFQKYLFCSSFLLRFVFKLLERENSSTH